MALLRARIMPSSLMRPAATLLAACGLAWWGFGAGRGVADEPPLDAEVAVTAAVSPTDAYFEHARRRDGQVSAAALGRRLLRVHAEDADVLDTLAWGILTDDTLRHRDLPLALAASRAALAAAGGEDLDVLETHARALFESGRRDEAVAVQRRAVERCDDPSTRLAFEEVLRAYADPPPEPGTTDEERIRAIEQAALALVDAGRAVSVADLLDRTSSEPCAVEISRPAEEPCPAESLYQRARPSVVVMAALEPDLDTGELEVSLATGFVVHASGVVVTNFHVIDVPESPVLVAMTADGAVHAVTSVLAVSPLADIAVCRLDGRHDLPALAFNTAARPGLHLHALSHPDAAFWSLTDGILSRFFVLREDGLARMMFTTTADFAVGSSGGPLLDERGNVVGMVSSTLAIYAAEGSTRRGARAAVRGPARAVPRTAARIPAAVHPDIDQPAGDFQMGLNMCVPAADILALLGAKP